MTDLDTLLAHSGWEPNRLENDRLEKLAKLLDREVDPYPRRVARTHNAQAAVMYYAAHVEAGGTDEDAPTVTVAGRIRRANIKGKVSFVHIEDESGRIQLFLRINDLGEETYGLVKEKLVDMDDFVQATGTLMKTRAGEVSIRASELKLLSKSLSPLPVVKEKHNEDGTVEEYGEFSNVETRYRQRYADLAVNKDVREVFVRRSKIINALRHFMDNAGFLEVETPILQTIYGGAAARPFTTHHNQLGQDLYLRISFELYLKRLLVGGYDAVYEIGRDFRNEGVSWKHNPEFTQIEFYKAYIDYNGVMELTEQMVAAACAAANDKTTITYQGEALDLTPPWERITLRDAIKQHSGIDYMDYREAPALEAAIKEKGDKIKPGQAWGQLVDHLLSEYVEPNLRQPTFLIDYPRDISPFAKRVAYDDFHTERFEFFIAGMEMGNAFTELNDPLDQERRFVDMARLYGTGSDEETPLDEDYLRAMRYGMPPNGGFGMGVDRLVMLLTDQRNIRDVLLYPHLKPETEG